MNRLLLIWAARDVLRRPAEGLLVSAALASLIWVAGTVVLLTEAVRVTAHRLIDAGPSLVIRRIGPAGFAPMPVSVTASVAAVPGALNVRARVWGPASTEKGAIEMIGLPLKAATPSTSNGPSAAASKNVPPPTAVVGPGFAPERGALMTVRGPGGAVDVLLETALPESMGVVAQDSFLVSADTARKILGLPAEMATDIGLDVFRESEEAAIRADLAAALPFPVAITSKSDAKRRYATSLTRRGGLFMLALLPAVLAIVALVAQAARDRAARGQEVGLLKTVGWTTRDIVMMHAMRAVWIALPSIGIGWALAWLSVFSGVRWPGTLLLGWAGRPPRLDLDPTGAAVVLLEVTVTAIVPWLIASVAPAIASAARDPGRLLAEDQG